MKKRNFIFFVACAVVSCFCAFGSAQAQDINSAAFEKAMGAYLSKDENVEKVGDSLQRYFMKKREEQMKQMEEERKKAEQEEGKQMEEQFKNPVQIDVGSSPVKGSANAKITIFIFSEFSCPFCKRVEDTLNAIEKEYGEQVRFVFKHVPLPMHPDARPAALASWAALQQGKFWQFHDELFTDQSKRGEDTYLEIAKKIGLNVEKFKTDMKSDAAAKAIDEDMALADKLQVRGTPGFFINGVQLRGAQPLPEFKKIIDRWLSMKK